MPNGLTIPKAPRCANFTEREILDLVLIIKDVCPQDSADWETVREVHHQMYPSISRSTNSLKRKFNALHRMKVPTGDPNIKTYVKEAKIAHRAIGDRAMLSTGQANEDQLLLADDRDSDIADAASASVSNEDPLAEEDPLDDLAEDAPGNRPGNQAQARVVAPVANQAGGRSNRDTSTIAVPRRSPTNRTRKSTADSVVEMMMLDMQQRQLEHQERMANLERERMDQRDDANQSRTMMATAIQAIAQAFVHHSGNN